MPLGDEVAGSAPTGRDSIAQGASALGSVAEKNVKPQRGEIPLPGLGFAAIWNLAPIGAGAVLRIGTQG